MSTIKSETSTKTARTGSLLVWASAPLFAAFLTACGGGGGGSDTPTPEPAPTNLAQSPTEARQAAEFSVGGAADLVSKSALVSNNPFIDAKVSSGLSGPKGPSVKAQSGTDQAPRRQAQAAAAIISCAESQIFTGPCTGSINIETDIVAEIYPANSFLSATFKSLSGTVSGQTLSLDGSFRLDFLTAVNGNAPTLANARYKITFSAFTGTFYGITVGPESSSILVEFDAQSVATITTGDFSFSKVAGLNTTDSANFSIGSAQVRKPYWGSAANKIDSTLTNWKVSAARPAVGSSATLTASNGAVAKVDVSSSGATSVVYAVQITAGSSVKRYTVTASYAAGSNTPTYTAVDAP